MKKTGSQENAIDPEEEKEPHKDQSERASKVSMGPRPLFGQLFTTRSRFLAGNVPNVFRLSAEFRPSVFSNGYRRLLLLR